MNPYIMVETPVTNNLTDIRFVTNGTGANNKSTISGFSASQLSDNAAFVNISFTNSENKVQRAAFFSTTLFIQIGTGNDSLPLVDKIDIWVGLINTNVITTTTNAATTNKFNVTAERVGDDTIRLRLKTDANLTAASSLTDSPDNFEVTLSDFTVSSNKSKFYTEPREVDYTPFTGIITAKDNAGATIAQAAGDTLRFISMTRPDLIGGIVDVLPRYTK